jgi:hypothetical protein
LLKAFIYRLTTFITDRTLRAQVSDLLRKHTKQIAALNFKGEDSGSGLTVAGMRRTPE